MRGFIDIEVIWNTDETDQKSELGLEVLLSECEKREVRFFEIAALNNFFDTDNTRYTQIHANGTAFYTNYSVDEVTGMIIEHL